MNEKRSRRKISRRDFSRWLSVVGGNFPLLGCFWGKKAPATQRTQSDAEALPFKEGIEAHLEGNDLHLDYRISSKSENLLKVPPARATFITAIHLASQQPLCCRLLEKVAGVTIDGPLSEKSGVTYHAKVTLTSIITSAKDSPALIHASFWQYRSEVLYYRAEA